VASGVCRREVDLEFQFLKLLWIFGVMVCHIDEGLPEVIVVGNFKSLGRLGIRRRGVWQTIRGSTGGSVATGLV
jgi:hypothetical protein